MGIFDRLSRLLRANVHAALDGAEDPEKMIDLLIRDAESGRVAGRQQLVAVIAERNRISAEADSEEKVAVKAQRQAEAAARKGDDELAREALRRRKDALEAAEIFSQQAESQQIMVERLKSQLSLVDDKMRRMYQERDRLVAQKRIADAQVVLAETAGKISISSIDSEFGRMTRKVREEEARAQASIEVHLEMDSLEGRLDALEDEGIEEELRALKELVGKTPEVATQNLYSIGPVDSTNDR